MLPFDDISNMQGNPDASAANAALDGDLSGVRVESRLGSEPVQNVSGFNQDIFQDFDAPQTAEEDEGSGMNGTLQAINSSLGAILGVQNEQLLVLRGLPVGASAERINSVNSSVENNSNSVNSSIENNSNVSNSNVSNLTQTSDFVSELQSLETTIKTLNANVNVGETNNTAQNNTNSSNSTTLNVERGFEAVTDEAGGSEFGQAFSLLNPRDREFLSYVSNFSSVQGSNSNVSAGNQTANNNFSVNNNVLGNTLQEIRDGDMTIDRTEIQNRVNQSSSATTTETNAQNSSIMNAFSTALAQHDQTLIQTITNVTGQTTQKQDSGIQLTGGQTETVKTRDVQKDVQTHVASNNEVLTMLSQISMQLMQLNATMGSALRKTSFT